MLNGAEHCSSWDFLCETPYESRSMHCIVWISLYELNRMHSMRFTWSSWYPNWDTLMYASHCNALLHVGELTEASDRNRASEHAHATKTENIWWCLFTIFSTLFSLKLEHPNLWGVIKCGIAVHPRWIVRQSSSCDEEHPSRAVRIRRKFSVCSHLIDSKREERILQLWSRDSEKQPK